MGAPLSSWRRFVQLLNLIILNTLCQVAEMMSPPEKEAVNKIHLKLDKLSKSQTQADETLFVLKMYLIFKSKS